MTCVGVPGVCRRYVTGLSGLFVYTKTYLQRIKRAKYGPESAHIAEFEAAVRNNFYVRSVFDRLTARQSSKLAP